MRFMKYAAPAVLAAMFATGAVADSLIQLNSFTTVPECSNTCVEMLRADAPPAAAGQPVTIYADCLPISAAVLVAGTNWIAVPQTHPKSYTISGPMIAAKTIAYGVN